MMERLDIMEGQIQALMERTTSTAEIPENKDNIGKKIDELSTTVEFLSGTRRSKE